MICIPLYVLTKEYINIYKACLKRINLTFTQFIVMVVLWRKREMRVKEIGKCLFLDSGTLTPVLKKLEAKGFVVRKRSDSDARDLWVSLTDTGESLMTEAKMINADLRKELRMEQVQADRIDELLRELIQLLADGLEKKAGKEMRVF